MQNATITGNTCATPTDHAIGLADHSTGAHVGGNTLHSGIGYEVGIDASSRRATRARSPAESRKSLGEEERGRGRTAPFPASAAP
ncbi:hypothetical protein ABZS86_13920 [Streptomyces sp. NPDC005355]|uniref:hypothetical protein n=1 Tax=Streptomyces sp. NPDC005355 TaxID=3157038 RepID=UPI0033BB5070